MILPDVNVLVYAHREDTTRHLDYHRWLREQVESERPYGLSDLVLSGFVRVVTNRRAFPEPTPMERALAAADALRERPNRVAVGPGPRHWALFQRLCREAGAKANLVPDAYLAAMAIESGCEWVTTDRDFARFPGLSWHHPLEG